MNLKEFIIDTFIENHMEWDDKKVEKMEDTITEYARKKADGGSSIAISESEVKQVIQDSGAAMEKMEAEKAEAKAREKAEKEAKLEQKKREEAEKEQMPYQLGLF